MSDPGSSGDGPDRRGSLRPTSGRVLALSSAVGLVVGWSGHLVVQRVTGETPRVAWVQPLGLLLVAVIIGVLAWHTWRVVQVGGRRLEPQQALNRLVLGRACAVAGALVAGFYLGFAIGWLGDPTRLAERGMTRSVVAFAAAMAVLVASLALESACRTPSDRSRP